MNEIDLLQIERGLVIAPAGCGKTHLITNALQACKEDKPILVLTHTNAGVVALRHRLTNLGVPRSSYRLMTIDGWAIRLASTFPDRAEYDGGANPKQPNYPRIRKAAARLLKSDHIGDVIMANYSRLLVDEYQDCSIIQHSIVFYAAQILPTCVLGDPMQAIFGFGDDQLAKWEDQVCKHFPIKAELNTPWRWKNANNEELGLWLLDTRKKLINRQSIDLTTAPKSVKWIELSGADNNHRALVSAARCTHKTKDETSLVIGDSMSAPSRYRIAKNVPGIVTVEPVDLKDFTEYAKNLDLSDGLSLKETLKFAETLITNVGANSVMQRIKSLNAGTARNEANDLERLALAIDTKPTYSGLSRLLSECSRQSGSRVYRPAVLRAAIKALNASEAGNGGSFEENAIRIREENRAVGRQLPKAAIGSTLLLKGLEADHVIVLNASNLDSRNLYVAMTRGARTISMCSNSQILKPVV